MRRIFFVIIFCLIFIISSSQMLVEPIENDPGESVIDQNMDRASAQEQIITPSEEKTTIYGRANYDKNHNKIHDSIELEITHQSQTKVYVSYDYLPTDGDVDALETLGIEVDYKCKYINAIITKEISLNALNKIVELPGVNFIEPLQEIKPALDISAPAVKARESNEYSPETAWELGYTGKGITIAVLDSGVDDNHPSLENKFVGGAFFTENFNTGEDGSNNPDDTMGHGTAVAGVAMGTGGSEGYYMGIAPDAKLVDVKVTRGVNSHLQRALEWCLYNKDRDWNENGPDEYDGIDVISISLNGDNNADGTSQLSQLLNTVVDAGIVVVTACGNDGPNNNGLEDVTSSDKVISVGNIDARETIDRADDVINPSSSKGPRRDDGDNDPYDELKPDVVAPGTDITTSRFSPIGQGGAEYGTYDGTSFSCPHVSGICALILEANPNLRPGEIKKILQETAEAMGEPDEPLLSDKYNYAYGYGSVDAYEAVKMAVGYVSTNHKPEIESVIASPKFVEPEGQSHISTIASDPDGDPLTYEYYATGGTIITYSGSDDATWIAPTELGQYDITVKVNDGLVSSEPASVTITVEENPTNHAPIIENVIVESTQVEPGESSTITVKASDLDEDELFYEYDASGGMITGTGQQVTWTAPDTNGKYSITITVNDGELTSDTERVVITVEGGPENRPPEIESFTANTNSIHTGGTVKLSVMAIDPENGNLEYSYLSTDGQLTGIGSNVDWTAPDIPDTYAIEVTVVDDMGLSDSEDIIIDVYQLNSPPEIRETHAYPETVANDGTVAVLFTVSVDDLNGLGDIEKVIIDLSALAGDETQKMYDNGKHGDSAKDDGVFSYSYLVPSGISTGSKKLPVSVQDRYDESTSQYIVLEITAASADSGDEGLLGEYLPVPAFQGVWVILACVLLTIFITGKRNRLSRRNS